MTALVVAAVAAAVWLARARPAADRLTAITSTAPVARRSDLGRLVGVCTGGMAGLLVTGSVLGMTVGATAGALADRALTARKDRRLATAAADALPDVLRLLAAELRTGAPPHVALAAAASAAPPTLAAHLCQVAAGAALGLAAADSLVPAPPGAEGLVALAACWRVSASTGAGLADGVTRLAAGLAADGRCRAEVEAQLAGPRATAAVLAVLPAVAVLLGAGLGADPLDFFRTPPGAACLGGGIALDLAGVAWTRRIAAGAAP